MALMRFVIGLVDARPLGESLKGSLIGSLVDTASALATPQIVSSRAWLSWAGGCTCCCSKGPLHTSKAPRHQGRQTKQRKKRLVTQCHKPWTAPHHRWEPHRSGFHCSACGIRLHQALTVPVIEERLGQQCPLLNIDETRPDQRSQATIPKKLTRAQVLRNIGHATQSTCTELRITCTEL